MQKDIIVAVAVMGLIMSACLSPETSPDAYEVDLPYCAQYSYDDCPEDRCEVGPSEPDTTDIGCFPKGHYERSFRDI